MGLNEYTRNYRKLNGKVESEEEMASAGFGLDTLTGSTGLGATEPDEVDITLLEAQFRKARPTRKITAGKRKYEAEESTGSGDMSANELHLGQGDILMQIKNYLPALKNRFKNSHAIKIKTLVTTAHLDSGVVDQKYVGSCVAFSIVAAMEHDLIRQDPDKNLVYKFSERQLYIVSRVYYDRICPNNDAGTTHFNALTAVQQFGLINESNAPYIEYDTVRFWVEAEGISSITENLIDRVEIFRVPKDIENIKNCLKDGYPVIIMFRAPFNIFTKTVYDTGIIPMSDEKIDNPKENHSVLCVGYDDKRKLLQFKNSWGKDWGVGGYGYIRYQNIILNTCWRLKTSLKNGVELRIDS